jgi:tetratricopeptide (TPR) repeat protein
MGFVTSGNAVIKADKSVPDGRFEGPIVLLQTHLHRFADAAKGYSHNTDPKLQSRLNLYPRDIKSWLRFGLESKLRVKACRNEIALSDFLKAVNVMKEERDHLRTKEPRETHALFGQALYELGLCYEQLGRYEEAESSLITALAEEERGCPNRGVNCHRADQTRAALVRLRSRRRRPS